jgi:hypothetical protein
MADQEKSGTLAAHILAELPSIREQAQASRDFRNWLETHKAVDVDGTRFYVVGGDMLKDDDEMIFSWARRTGILDQQTIERLQAQR